MKKIPVGKNGDVCFVDDEDYEEMSTYGWYLSEQGYANANVHLGNGKKTIVKMHRVLLNTPKGIILDHKDGNRLNNQKENLRECTRSQNLQNQHVVRGSTSKYKGVYWNKQIGKWRAKIQVNGRSVHLGLFVNEEDAALAYDGAAEKFYGEFACINF